MIDRNTNVPMATVRWSARATRRDPDIITADLVARAEHGPDAPGWLITSPVRWRGGDVRKGFFKKGGNVIFLNTGGAVELFGYEHALPPAL